MPLMSKLEWMDGIQGIGYGRMAAAVLCLLKLAADSGPDSSKQARKSEK